MLPSLLPLALSSSPAPTPTPFCLTPWDGTCSAPTQPPFPRPPPSTYKHGNCPRFVVFVTSQGSAADPPSLSLTIEWPDGTNATGVVYRDVQGQYHADVAIPSTMATGLGAYRWQVGPDNATPENNAACERRFEVLAPAF